VELEARIRELPAEEPEHVEVAIRKEVAVKRRDEAENEQVAIPETLRGHGDLQNQRCAEARYVQSQGFLRHRGVDAGEKVLGSLDGLVTHTKNDVARAQSGPIGRGLVVDGLDKNRPRTPLVKGGGESDPHIRPPEKQSLRPRREGPVGPANPTSFPNRSVTTTRKECQREKRHRQILRQHEYLLGTTYYQCSRFSEKETSAKVSARAQRPVADKASTS